MRRFVLGFAIVLVAATMAFAQSSGNFTYGTQQSNHNGTCSLDGTGAISGGEQCVSSCDLAGNCVTMAGTCMGHAVAGIKSSSGSGNVFNVVVSAVIGLLTDVTVSSKQAADANGVVSSSALAGANFQVTALDPNGNAVNNIIPSYPVTFDSRYVQISTNLFTAIAAACAPALVANPLGCFISFNESTVSAHTFQFLIPQELTTGHYTITTSWQDTASGSGIFKSLVCVSDVIETVQQNKIFHFNTIN